MSWPFTSDRRNGSRRKGRNSFSSKISLSSALTSSSSTTNRSDSTVTTGFHAGREPRGKSRSGLEVNKPRTTLSTPNISSQPDEPASRDSAKALVDVFQYLDTWDSRAASQLSLVEPIPEDTFEAPPSKCTEKDEGQSHEPQEQIPQEQIPQEPELDHTPGSFHSDSGISMQDSSAHQSPLATKARSVDFEPITRIDTPPKSNPGLQDFSPTSPCEPESFYRDENALGPKPWRPWATTKLAQFKSRPPSEPEPSSIPDKPPTSSASNPARQPIPLYRTFNTLNHTILTTWQDDLIHLETLLTQLDINGRFPPLEHHRRDILEQISSKLEQYNRLLCLTQQVQRTFSPATAAELADLRHHLQSPYSPTDQYLLSHDPQDLISVPRSKSQHSNRQIASTLRVACMLPTVAVVVPALVVPLIPSFVARIALVLGTSTLLVTGWRSLDLNTVLVLTEYESKVCLLGYLAVMAGMAVLY